ncbi:MAG: hypothetical protein AB8B55_13040 [Mariniblastus sp.]
MFESTERLMLVVDMLDGVPESHKILADLLEESGDRGLAQWARSRKSNQKKRLSFALAVLPYRKSLQIGCHFLATRLNSEGLWIEPLVEEINSIHGWAQEPVDVSRPASEHTNFLIHYKELVEAIDRVGEVSEFIGLSGNRYRSEIYQWIPKCLGVFDSAVEWAQRTTTACQNNDYGGQRNAAAQTKAHIRKMVELISRNPVLKAERDPKGAQTQMKIDHVKNAIAKMIESGT